MRRRRCPSPTSDVALPASVSRLQLALPSNASPQRKVTSAKRTICNKQAIKHKRFAQPDDRLPLMQQLQAAQPKRRGYAPPPSKRLPTLDVFLLDLPWISPTTKTRATAARLSYGPADIPELPLTSNFEDRRHDHDFRSKSLDTKLGKKRHKQARYALRIITKN